MQIEPPVSGERIEETRTLSASETQSYRPLPSTSRFTIERIVRWSLGLGAILVLGWFLWYFANLVVYLLIGILLAYFVRPLADRLQSLGLGRITAIIITFLLVFGTVSVLLTYLVPFIAIQIRDLSRQVTPEAIGNVAVSIEQGVSRYIPVEEGDIRDAVTDGVQTLFKGERITQIAGSMVGVFTDIFYAVLVIPFVMFFVLKDGAMMRRNLLMLVPNRYFEITLAIMEKIQSNIGRYFRGLFMQCISIALVASLLLTIAGLNYGVAVGIFAGLANTIPYFGPLMGFLAGGLVGIAQTGDFSLLFGVLIAMGLTQLADNLFFQPLIFSRAAQTHPLVILMVVLMGAKLAGIVGMLVAIPLTTIVRVAVDQVLWSLRNYRILQATR